MEAIEDEGYENYRRKKKQIELYNPILVPRRAMVDYWMSKGHKGASRERREALLPYENITTPIPFKPSTFFFRNFGSSFSQTRLFHERDDLVRKARTKFTATKIQVIITFADKVLSDDMLTYLDYCALEVYEAKLVLVNPYMSFSETLKLVWITFLQELLCCYSIEEREDWKESSPVFYSLTRDMQKFSKQLFIKGQKDIQLKVYDASEQEQKDSNFTGVNRFKANVQTVATCVDILVWAELDETGGDLLCTKLTEKIASPHGLKLALGHLPIIIACLEGIRNLAEAFPLITDICTMSLRDFISSPAPLLLKLYQCMEEFTSGDNAGIRTICQSALRQARDAAIESICGVLKVGMERDPECVQAYLASASNRMYQAEISGGEGALIAINTVMALGKIAVALKGTFKTEKSVLQFFQQRFCKPPSTLDTLIVDQMGRMLVAKVDRPVRDEIMKMLTMITLVANSVHSKTSQAESK